MADDQIRRVARQPGELPSGATLNAKLVVPVRTKAPEDGTERTLVGTRDYYEDDDSCDSGEAYWREETWLVETFEDGRLVDSYYESFHVRLGCR